jgi:hypothetical protein
MVTLCSYHRRSNVAIRKEWTVDLYCASFINSKSATVELADEIPEAPDRHRGFGVSGYSLEHALSHPGNSRAGRPGNGYGMAERG